MPPRRVNIPNVRPSQIWLLDCLLQWTPKMTLVLLRPRNSSFRLALWLRESHQNCIRARRKMSMSYSLERFPLGRSNSVAAVAGVVGAFVGRKETECGRDEV